jgi:hypothetical protein
MVGDHQQPAALEAIAQDTGEQQPRDLRKRPGEADDRQRSRLVRDVVDEPGDRHQVDAVADERHGPADSEQPEVAVPQRAEHRPRLRGVASG